MANANPAHYVQRYGSSLIPPDQLPEFVTQIRPPTGIVLAAEHRPTNVHELEGDIEALNLIDLDREGLSQYKDYLRHRGYNNFGGSQLLPTHVESTNVASSYSATHIGQQQSSSYHTNHNAGSNSFWSPGMNPVVNSISEFNPSNFGASSNYGVSSGGSVVNVTNISAVISQIFSELDRDSNGQISVEEAEKVLLRMNSRLSRNYGDNEVKAFFLSLDINQDGTIDLSEFKRAFEQFQFQ